MRAPVLCHLINAFQLNPSFGRVVFPLKYLYFLVAFLLASNVSFRYFPTVPGGSRVQRQTRPDYLRRGKR